MVIKDEPIPASIKNIYVRLALSYKKINSIRKKLEFLVNGEGEKARFDDDTPDGIPQVSYPSMRTISNIVFDLDQQINLCNQLVNTLKDGGTQDEP